MERKTAERFIGEKVAFTKMGGDQTLTGILKEIIGSDILIEFKGRLQAHKLEDITWMEEGEEGWKALRDGRRDDA